ncbi:GDSL-type esterase/lipase family protein [Streptomyces sp. NBC_01358]
MFSPDHDTAAERRQKLLRLFGPTPRRCRTRRPAAGGDGGHVARAVRRQARGRKGHRAAEPADAGSSSRPPEPHRARSSSSAPASSKGEWDEWFPGPETLNRGIGGNTIDDLATRPHRALRDPLIVVLLVGTNDLRDPALLSQVDEIAVRMESLVSRIRTAAPAPPPRINNVLPRARIYADSIRALNKRYARIADEAGVTYVDL